MAWRTSKRTFLKAGAVLSALAASGYVALGGRERPTPPADDGWDRGSVNHILPTANHHRFLLKASFRDAQPAPPAFTVDGREVAGRQTDSGGQFFLFDADDLEADTTYDLQLVSASGTALCDRWHLKTFPPPDAGRERFRLLAFTCAGGPDHLYNFGFFNAWLLTPTRQRLFARALSFAPDAAVANGDHVYWDLKSSGFLGNSLRARTTTGLFDPSQPVMGSGNEAVLQRAFGPQIAGLYGVRFRSLPMFFLQDDHDYGENDEADDRLRTFPADAFMRDLARSTQRMYYPEFLPDGRIPAEYVNGENVSEHFGSLRYGTLYEGLLYDCRRFMTNELDPDLGHTQSRFVPQAIEEWLVGRSRDSDSVHLAQMPSTPVLWTAGKWGEWYPDVMQEDGTLGTATAKPYWPEGWLRQHDRLLDAASARKGGVALFISGDLHATGTGRILANQGHDYRDNPVVSVLSGAIGTGALGWPSKFRGTPPVPSAVLETEILEQPVEENGFSLIDFTPNGVTIAHFKWRPDMGEQAIDTLEPFSTISLPV